MAVFRTGILQLQYKKIMLPLFGSALSYITSEFTISRRPNKAFVLNPRTLEPFREN